MRSLFSRLALVGIVGVALAGCGTQSGSSLPVGGALNSGGGPTNISQQNPPAGTIPGVLVDGGTKPYTGFNTTATDTLVASPAETTDTPKLAPADVPGSHSIVYSGNGLTQQIFRFSGSPVSLVIPSGSASGDILPVNFGAVVFFATPPTSAASLSLELVGGANASAFDVRVACAGTAVTPSKATPPPFQLANRYVCTLPTYGAVPTTQPAQGTGTYNVNFPNPAVTNSSTGSFTPTAATLYIVANDSAPLATTSTTNTLLLDYLYAEQGTT